MKGWESEQQTLGNDEHERGSPLNLGRSEFRGVWIPPSKADECVAAVQLSSVAENVVSHPHCGSSCSICL